jgi:hypothetical protein
MIAVFAVLGGRYSVGKELWRSEPARRLLPSVVWKFLATGRGQPFGALARCCIRATYPARRRRRWNRRYRCVTCVR